jgi:hypothetical protein
MKIREIITLVEATDPLPALAKRFQQAGMGGVHIVRDQWLVHFTNKADAAKIATQGFTRGSPLNTRDLTYTVGSGFKTPGINFAYPTDDEQELRLNLSVVPPDAVMFRADGVRMRHMEDFLQVAFMGQDARGPFIQIRQTTEGDWKVIAIDGKAIKNGAQGSLVDVVASVTGRGDTP